MADDRLIFRKVSGTRTVRVSQGTPRKPLSTAEKRHRDRMPGFRASLDFTVKDREVRRTF